MRRFSSESSRTPSSRSRGSAKSYALVALDHSSGSSFFKRIMANSGGVMLDYPSNQDMVRGRFGGGSPFQGLRWARYCGCVRKPGTGACPAMEKARGWVESYGARVELRIRDPTGGHGGSAATPACWIRAVVVRET